MPRLSIILTEEQMDKMDTYLPWGTKQAVFSSLVDMMNQSIEQYGPKLIGLLINGEFNLITKEIKLDESRRHSASDK